jgi:hypothetical protein
MALISFQGHLYVFLCAPCVKFSTLCTNLIFFLMKNVLCRC